MCGVVGVFAYGPLARSVDRDELRTVRDHMHLRGPDGAGEWFSDDGRVGLGHRRLSIIDLSVGANQPMHSADGQLVISFNGEIYNHRELRRELEAQGCVFRTQSDTETILQLYAREGDAMLARLRGMYALALWDARRGAMLLARDPLGIKPLYYADNGQTLRVASQVKALLRAPVDRSPDPAGLVGFFLWGSVPEPWTTHRGIRALPAGHFQWFGSRGGQGPQAFWDLARTLADAYGEPARVSRDDAIDGVVAALDESVRAHLVADVPVGLFLSAGLDSAMIGHLAASQVQHMRSVTLGFDVFRGGENDELPLAESLAAGLGTAHHSVRVAQADFSAERERLFAAMDQPSIDGINTWFVARAAAQQGLRVALSGLGGDELLASYPSFRQVPLLSRTLRPFHGLKRLGRFSRWLSAPIVRRLSSPKYAGLLEYGGSVGGSYMLRRGLYMPWELPALLDPDLVREGWQTLQPVAQLDAVSECFGVGRDSRLALSALEMRCYMRHQLLVDADWAGMAHSLEIRVPFVDHRLYEQAAPLLAAHPDIRKPEVAARCGAMSDAVLRRTKTGFVVPVREWLHAGAANAATGTERGLRGWARFVDAAYFRSCVPRRLATPQVRRPTALVATLKPGLGGVHAMLDFALEELLSQGYEPVIAYYAPYSQHPELSVPSFALGRRRPSQARSFYRGEFEMHALGCWLPELEFTNYACKALWAPLIQGSDLLLAASGNALAASAFLDAGRSYSAWVATDWAGDRRDRVHRFRVLRRWFDHGIVRPVTARLERRILGNGTVIPLSLFTARALAALGTPNLHPAPLAVPVDTGYFVPRPTHIRPGRLGFAGRFCDPRKNIGLFLSTLARLRRQGLDVEGRLLGDEPSDELLAEVDRLGIGAHLRFAGRLSRQEFRDELQTWDLFLLTSHQEGLCIAALEAMACGVPVVSTRCGGPEEFVLDGETGRLVLPDTEAMSEAAQAIIGDAQLAQALRAGARRRVCEHYSSARAAQVFHDALNAPASVRA